MREDIIHFAVRQFLKTAGWRLVAGQYPDGSDDELPPLNVVDPILARDGSPDHRRHSMNKYVPDLVACKQRVMLLIEMKPRYSLRDERKLKTLVTDRRADLLEGLYNLTQQRGVELAVPISEVVFVPCLGFGITSRYERNPMFCYFKVSGLSSVVFEGNTSVPKI